MNLPKPVNAVIDRAFENLILDNMVHSDAAHVAHLILEGKPGEADDYSRQPDVQARIQAWKAKRS